MMLKRVSVVATVGMFLVLVMGATVTNTGSAEGCGRSWPLCHGQFIPEFAVATLIEFSHRLVTGVAGLIVAALAVGAWVRWRHRREVQVLVPLMIGTLLLQSWLGASAVLHPQAPPIKALHFGVSLVSFASVFLTMAFIFEINGAEHYRDRPVPSAFRWAVWASLLAVYGVVYLGAFVRHTGASLACVGWPLCNGVVFPGFVGPTGIVFAHRVAALGVVVFLAGLTVWAHRLRAERPDLWLGSLVTLGLAVLQSLSGAVVVFSALSLFSALAHAAIMTLLFGSLSYLGFHVLPRPVGRPVRDRLVQPAPEVKARV